MSSVIVGLFYCFEKVVGGDSLLEIVMPIGLDDLADLRGISDDRQGLEQL